MEENREDKCVEKVRISGNTFSEETMMSPKEETESFMDVKDYINFTSKDDEGRQNTDEAKTKVSRYKNIHGLGQRNCYPVLKCQVCNRAFARKSNLIDHLRLHAKVKLFQCNYCNKSFVQIANYRTHMHTHTGERPYECHLCSKAYTQSGALKIHIRSHTGERNYRCLECDKAFTNVSDLSKHKRIHDPMKQFKCNVCDRLFSQKINMISHLRRMHTT